MPAKREFTGEQIEFMRRMYLQAASFKDIAEVFGCAKNTIRANLLAAGVVPDVSRSISAKRTGKSSPRKGAKCTAESKRRMSLAQIGRSPGRTGPHSEETRRKISAALRALPPRITPEQARLNAFVRGLGKRLVRRVLKATGAQKVIPSQAYLGYSGVELSAHLGPRPDDSHLDHYVPVVEFIKRGIVAPSVINAQPNLGWLPAAVNRSKSARVPADADRIVALCIADAAKRLTAHFGPSGTTYTDGL